MGHRIVWAAAVLVAFVALVAGCISVSAPKGPYVVAGEPRQPTAAERSRVQTMDKSALENEVLRLAAENDGLRQDLEKQKRENKILKSERDRYKDRVNDLEDKIKDMR